MEKAKKRRLTAAQRWKGYLVVIENLPEANAIYVQATSPKDAIRRMPSYRWPSDRVYFTVAITTLRSGEYSECSWLKTAKYAVNINREVGLVYLMK